VAAGTGHHILLTAREREVARAVAEGLTDRQIASRLCISERTVHAHLRPAYAKTETGSRTVSKSLDRLTNHGRYCAGHPLPWTIPAWDSQRAPQP